MHFRFGGRALALGVTAAVIGVGASALGAGGRRAAVFGAFVAALALAGRPPAWVPACFAVVWAALIDLFVRDGLGAGYPAWAPAASAPWSGFVAAAGVLLGAVGYEDERAKP